MKGKLNIYLREVKGKKKRLRFFCGPFYVRLEAEQARERAIKETGQKLLIRSEKPMKHPLGEAM